MDFSYLLFISPQTVKRILTSSIEHHNIIRLIEHYPTASSSHRLGWQIHCIDTSIGGPLPIRVVNIESGLQGFPSIRLATNGIWLLLLLHVNVSPWSRWRTAFRCGQFVDFSSFIQSFSVVFKTVVDTARRLSFEVKFLFLIVFFGMKLINHISRLMSISSSVFPSTY